MADTIEEFKLYDGKVKLFIDHSKTRHRYLVTKQVSATEWSEQEIVEGVTSYLGVIPKFLMDWAARMSSQYWVDLLISKSLAQDIITKGMLSEHHELARKEYVRLGNVGKNKGTDMHTALEMHFRNIPFDETTLSLEVFKLYRIVVDWFSSSGWENLGAEDGCFSLKFNYAGKIDLKARTTTGKRVICDFKSTKLSRQAPDGAYLEYFIQMGGYAQCLLEEGEEVDDMVILNPNYTDESGRMIPTYASTFGMAVEDAIHAFNLCKILTDTISYWERKKTQS